MFFLPKTWVHSLKSKLLGQLFLLEKHVFSSFSGIVFAQNSENSTVEKSLTWIDGLGVLENGGPSTKPSIGYVS